MSLWTKWCTHCYLIDSVGGKFIFTCPNIPVFILFVCILDCRHRYNYTDEPGAVVFNVLCKELVRNTHKGYWQAKHLSFICQFVTGCLAMKDWLLLTQSTLFPACACQLPKSHTFCNLVGEQMLPAFLMTDRSILLLCYSITGLQGTERKSVSVEQCLTHYAFVSCCIYQHLHYAWINLP